MGKESEEYTAIVNTLIMHQADMESLGISPGDTVRVRNEHGESTFQCEKGNVPEGMLFVPYGPPTCRLMGGSTDGTGMPLSKGWDVEVEKVTEGSGFRVQGSERHSACEGRLPGGLYNW